MKGITLILNRLVVTMIFAAGIFLAGCEDDELLTVDISNVDVISAYPLEDVTLQGTNFNTVQFVFVGTRQASFQLDGNVLTYQVPESAAPGMNTVTLAMASNYRVTSEIEVLVRPFPVIKTITPSAATAGQDVTITGQSLTNVESVMVGESMATVVSATGGELVFTVPDGLPNNIAQPITITTSGGEATSTSTFYVGENMVANGQFEAGEGDEFTNWSKYNGADLLTATTAADEVYTGRALRAVGFGSDAWRTQLASDPIEMEVGVDYTLLIWIKAEAGSPGDGGNIRFSTTPNALYSGNYDITSEWQQIEWTFTANDVAPRIVLDLGVVENAVYFVDNVTLIATGNAGPQPVDLILNGSFEEGDGDNFTNWSKFNGADLLTATTNGDEVYAGSRALKAIGFGSDAWRTQMASDVMATEVGVEYTASFWIRAEAGSPGDGGAVRMSTAGNGSAQYQGDVTVTTEWQKVEWTFAANGTETQIVMDLGVTENAVYFVDDVRFLAPPE